MNDEARRTRDLHTSDEVTKYAGARNVVPGTILWSADVSLTEDAFRSGGKTGAAVNFLRWKDIGFDDRDGRIPDEALGGYTVKPGQGISMFIKKILPQTMTWVGPGPVTRSQEKIYKQEFSPMREQYWWKLEQGQVLPAGLVLVYDGVPPGHCTLTVTREITVKEFLSLVLMLRFRFEGSDIFGIRTGGGK